MQNQKESNDLKYIGKARLGEGKLNLNEAAVHVSKKEILALLKHRLGYELWY